MNRFARVVIGCVLTLGVALPRAAAAPTRCASPAHTACCAPSPHQDGACEACTLRQAPLPALAVVLVPTTAWTVSAPETAVAAAWADGLRAAAAHAVIRTAAAPDPPPEPRYLLLRTFRR